MEKAYYRGALAALRFIEQTKPTGRRFGGEADARWASFRGDLTTSDRLDLLIRDANAQWPEAFGARTVFALRAVAEDEPFGASFESLDPVDAEELWRAAVAAPPPRDLTAVLSAVAAAWDIRLVPFDCGTIGAAEKLLVVGPSAIASAISAFAGGRDLDWTDQVTVIATPPGHRQIAALAGALLGATKPTAIWTAGGGSKLRGRRLLASVDADPADAQRARELVA
jgi:hypothetical protein